MWNSIFVAIRNFEPERDTAMYGVFNLSNIHGRIVASCGRVVNTANELSGSSQYGRRSHQEPAEGGSAHLNPAVGWPKETQNAERKEVLR